MRGLLTTSIFLLMLTLGAWAEDNKKESSVEDLPLRKSAREMLDEGEGLKHRRQLAGSITTLKAQCPVCEERFSAYHMTEADADKGIDRDFCRHSKQVSNLDLDIWTCTSCGFSHFKNFFNQPLDPPLSEATKKKQEAFLAKAFVQALGINIKRLGFKIDQQDIPRAIKFSLMENLLPHLDLPWKVKADFHLRFAWSERLRACHALKSPFMSGSIGNINSALKAFEKRHKLTPILADPAQVLLFLDHYLENQTSAQSRFLAHIIKSSQLNRMGFLHEASDELKKAILMENPEPIRELAVFRNRLLDNQINHFKEAIIATKESLRTEDHSKDELQSTIYLLGELQRRIGLFAEAKIWLQTYLELDENALKPWAEEQLSAFPKSIGLAPDSEKILAQTTFDRYQNIKKEEKGNLDPSKISQEQVRRWLSEINIAAVTYHRKFKLDPENLIELHQLGYLKGQPDLEPMHLRFFILKSNASSPLASTRYTVQCLIPLFDEEGSFMASSARGRLIRTPTNRE